MVDARSATISYLRASLLSSEPSPIQPPAVLAVPMGQGELPYEAFLRALQAHGYDGWVTYEMCSPIRGGGARGNLESYARTFLEFMRSFDQVPAARREFS